MQICSRCGKSAEKPALIVLYIMRHGRTRMNDRRLIIGSIDDTLNETGNIQAKEAAQKIPPPDFVAYSTLSRARETAEIINPSFLHMRPDWRLRERCVGSYEGQPEFPGMLEKFLGEETPDPGAEPLSLFRQRVLEALDEYSNLRLARTLIVTHALPLLVMLSEIRGWGLEQILKYEVPPNCVPVEFYVAGECGCGSKFYEKGLE